MTDPIGPGDWVECVDAARRNPTNSTADLLTKGALYLAERVALDERDDLPIIWLSGRVSNDSGGAFAADRFRPIYRPKADLIEALKAPVTRTPKVVRDKSRADA